MDSNKRWYSWAIKRNRYKNVITYIKENAPEVDSYFYPMIKKEYQGKRGSKIKDCPLYEGYLFLRYNDPDRVYHKLRACPFITTFAGSVEPEEIIRMEAAQGKLITEVKLSRFNTGDVVILRSGPFESFEAVVIDTASENIKVRIDAQILGQSGISLVFSEDNVEHKSKLQNAGVQAI